jgi:aspartyl-tRNA(Asn)/glutamyl-tRNA(Gln) amidotransferase subunit B
MRSKEDALDYRYFPEPDLPPLLLDEAILDEMNNAAMIIPADFIEVYTQTYGFHKEYINVLIGSPHTHRYFHALLQHDLSPQTVVKWLAGPIAAYCKEQFVDIDQLPFGIEHMVTFLTLLEKKTISNTQAKIVMKEMLLSGDTPVNIITKHKFDEA